MTHRNLVSSAAAVLTVIPKIASSDVYLAYLPLAHVFELEAEIVMFSAGMSIGYGSPLTLTDTSNKIIVERIPERLSFKVPFEMYS